MRKDIIDRVIDVIGVSFDSELAKTEFSSSLSSVLEKRFGSAIMPDTHESLVLSTRSPKTAALSFDRVYRIPALIEPIPQSIGFYGATTSEILFMTFAVLLAGVQDSDIELNISGVRINSSSVYLDNNQDKLANERRSLRFLSSEFPQIFGRMPTIFYHAAADQSHDFPNGPCQVLAAAIRNIALVNEEDLEWDQVLEFRKDSQSRIKYRRLVRWIDDELTKQPADRIDDAIALRLDDYEWAIKKHGMRTIIGSLSCLLDPKFLAKASAITATTSVVGGGVWAELCATALVIGQSALSFSTAYIDGLAELRGTNYELAYLHEIRREFNKST